MTSSGSWATRLRPPPTGSVSSPWRLPPRSTPRHRRVADPNAPGSHILTGMLTAIDHIGVAVEDIDAALALYRDTLELALVHRETVSEQGVEAVLLDVGESHVELLQPLRAD